MAYRDWSIVDAMNDAERLIKGEFRAPDLMTTKEVAAYLLIKERRVYELVRRQEIPCTRATGKWLFPKTEIDLWLAEDLRGDPATQAPPQVIAGSHDPLLDWAVKESGCGLALLPGGSLDGMERLAAGEAVVAGLHLLDAASGDFNLPAVKARLSGPGWLLLEWAWRQQGLVLAADNPRKVRGLADLAAKRVRVMPRQSGAGSWRLLGQLMADQGLALDELSLTDETARGETDLGLAILEGRAEAGIAVEAVARSLGLTFLPLKRERYDLLLRRRDYFEPAFQALLAFTGSEAFKSRAARMGGYDIAGLGTVRYNGP